MGKVNLTTKQAIEEVKALIKEVENLKTSTRNVNKANAESFDKLSSALEKMNKIIENTRSRMRFIESSVRSQKKAFNELENSYKKTSNAIVKNTNETNKNTNAKKKNNVATSKQVGLTNKLFGSVKSLLGAFGILAGVQLFAKVLKNTYETIKTFDSLSFAMERVTETTFAMESSQRFMIELTRDFGVELVSTTNRWIKFLAAAKQSGLSLQDTEKIFRSLTKAGSVLGLKTHELEGIYLALEQMLSKGKVTTEELRRQLGERLPGAMGIMAASMGKTIPELDKMMKRGEVLSAEVLPGFADAVEVAFGLDTVDKVETLVAEQNRLTTSWQMFIKNMSEGDSVIKKVLGGLLKYISGVIDGMNLLAESHNQEVRRRTGIAENEFREQMEAEHELQAIIEHGFKSKTELQEKYNDTKAKLLETSNEDEKKALKKQLDELQIILNDVNKKKQASMKVEAAQDLDIAREQYKEALDIYEEYLDELEKPAKEGGRKRIAALKAQGVEFQDLEKFGDITLEQLKGQVSHYGAIYATLKKIVETSKVNVLPTEDDGGKTQRRLKEVRDLSKEIQVEILKKSIQTNEGIISAQETGFAKQIDLIKENNDKRQKIIDLQFQIEIDKINKNEREKVASLKASVESGSLSPQKASDQEEKLAEEATQKIIIAYEKREKAIVAVKNDSVKKLLAIDKDLAKAEIAIAKDPFNVKIAEIKQVFEESEKSASDREKMEQDLKKVAVDSANAQLDVQIKLLEAKLKILDLDKEVYDEIKRQINELKASKQTFVPDDEKDWEGYFMDILDYARDFASAMGDIVDGLFGRRIENINAEIEAEKNKYDALILLARDDDEEQQTLRRNKDATIAKLEKKRLKEEQKQAKARKAFAIADIGISTAQAIMGIWAQVPKFDFGVTAGIMTAFVGALGAAQIAAVLAQPIPKYKDGGNITKDEVAMINDGVAQEYVERNNKIYTTERKDAIVALRRGDIVYKDHDEMVNKSSVYKRVQATTFKDDDRLLLGITNSINKGFKKVKIDNKIALQPQRDNSYKEEMSRWNN